MQGDPVPDQPRGSASTVTSQRAPEGIDLPGSGTDHFATPAPSDAASEPGGSQGTGAARQPTSGLVVSIVAAALIGALAFGALGDRPASNDSPATETTGFIYWFAAVVVIVGAGIGAQYADLTAATAAAAVGQPRRAGALPTAWAVPAMATFGATLLVASYHNIWMLAAGPIVTFLGIAGSLFSRDLLDDVGDSANRVASVIHTLIVHLVAFVAFGTIYLNKFPDWLGAALVGIVTAALILETLERSPASPARRLAYAGLGALVMWQATIAINWWQTSGWTGGLALLVCFYLIAGILVTYCQQLVVRSRDLAWYGGLSAVALIILAVTAR